MEDEAEGLSTRAKTLAAGERQVETGTKVMVAGERDGTLVLGLTAL